MTLTSEMYGFEIQTREKHTLPITNSVECLEDSACQALIVQMLDGPSHWISIWETNCVIHWMDFYPVNNTFWTTGPRYKPHLMGSADKIQVMLG